MDTNYGFCVVLSEATNLSFYFLTHSSGNS